MTEKQDDVRGIMEIDEQKTIRKIDRNMMLNTVLDFPRQIEEAITIAEAALKDLKPFARLKKKKFDKIVVSGLGGSAIGGDILAAWLADKIAIPILVSRDYALPRFVDTNTLVIVASYSGNTEETLSSFVDAKQKKASIIGISSDGKLQEFCEKTKTTFIKIKSELQPREATAYMLFPMIVALQKLRIIRAKKDIDETITHLKTIAKKLGPETPRQQNPAKRIAVALKGKTPVIYGSRYYAPIAKRWHTQFNENSKIVGWDGAFPEVNHNETVGWGSDKNAKNFSVIFLRGGDESPQIKTRVNFTKKLIEGRGAQTFEVLASGPNDLAKMMHAMFVGDVTSIYLALLGGIDPTPVEIIEKLKKTIGKLKTVEGVEEKLTD